MLRWLSLIAVLLAAPALADECRAVDGTHGKVAFEVPQAGSPFRGTFKNFGGTVCFAGGRVTRVDVWLEPASVDTGLPEIDAAIGAGEFFAVQKFQRVSYASTSVDARAGGGVAHGTLDIKGKAYPLDVPFSVMEEGAGAPVIAGELTLDRLRYGIGTGEWANTDWLGGAVKVRFRAPLR